MHSFKSGVTLGDFAAARRLLFQENCSPEGYEQEYVYSRDMTNRYAYRLSWDASRPFVLWVMLNPGTGETEQRRRNTLERCKAWSRSWGYGGLLIGNAFSARTKSAKHLAAVIEPSNPLNDEALMLLSQLATETVAAWGCGGSRFHRSHDMQRLLLKPKCLGTTKSGEPRHPLYVTASTVLVEWHNQAPAQRDA